VEIPVTLQVLVIDSDGDKLNVRFYNAFDDSLIAMEDNVNNNSISSVVWSGLNFNLEYQWYVIVSDGLNETISETWKFKTRGKEKFLEVTSIKGGFGLSMVITNTGIDDIDGVQWNISIRSVGLFNRPNVSDEEYVEMVPSGENFAISLRFFGFGRVNITLLIKVGNDHILTKIYNGFVIGPFLILQI
jgi:hypothetical protein